MPHISLFHVGDDPPPITGYANEADFQEALAQLELEPMTPTEARQATDATDGYWMGLEQGEARGMRNVKRVALWCSLAGFLLGFVMGRWP